jgi:hypothetical protein
MPLQYMSALVFLKKPRLPRVVVAASVEPFAQYPLPWLVLELEDGDPQASKQSSGTNSILETTIPIFRSFCALQVQRYELQSSKL